MSETSGPRSGIMHAVLREIEPRLFRAEYSGEINPQNPDERKIPDFHVGTDVGSVKLWVKGNGGRIRL
jgi:hypothetical protein